MYFRVLTLTYTLQLELPGKIQLFFETGSGNPETTQ